jgi:hypothetical protein
LKSALVGQIFARRLVALVAEDGKKNRRLRKVLFNGIPQRFTPTGISCSALQAMEQA